MNPNIPFLSDKKRVLIVGGGFAGLKLASELINNKAFQIVLLDKQNYHQFQPLFYQVATAGLEPSAISFPFRKLFQSEKNFHFRLAIVNEIKSAENKVLTHIGEIEYDYLILAPGADTNYFGNENLKKFAIPMKSTPEALGLRNIMLSNYEKALIADSMEDARAYMNIIIVGGGPTGVEVAGAMAEMKKYILPKDYPELNSSIMSITLVEASDRLLLAMNQVSSGKALEYLNALGVDVKLKTSVKDYDGNFLEFSDGTKVHSKVVIWAAGVIANKIAGLQDNSYGRGQRLMVDEFNRVRGYENIYCIGDTSLMHTTDYPAGHPQVAQVAIQQGKNLAKNLVYLIHDKPLESFKYKDLGSMATIGRNKAVVELPGFKFQGIFAWFVWMLVHLKSILGVKNQILILINWMWSYFTYDQSLRLIIKPKIKDSQSDLG